MHGLGVPRVEDALFTVPYAELLLLAELCQWAGRGVRMTAVRRHGGMQTASTTARLGAPTGHLQGHAQRRPRARWAAAQQARRYLAASHARARPC